MNDALHNPSAVRAQLSRLMDAVAFRESERHRRLLEFLVEATLRGEADGLKEFVIAAEVWGRDVSFDPRIHSTVRVEVGRLRARLERYYSGEGAQDAIRFRIPTGGYGVVFASASPQTAPSSGGDSHFEMVELIGRGGMGEVWKARDRRLGRDVALKFISRDLAKNRVARQSFEREARAAAALNHPNICTVYDVGESNGQPFLAMELLEGETLEQRLTGKDGNGGYEEVPVESLVDWGIEIADALEAAHSRGIVHSDLKPANLFLTARGQTKILDFGLARLVGEGDRDPEGKRKTAPAGTVGYMSPEQAKGEEIDPRSDIYSLGIVLYRAATGRLPEPSSGPPSSHNSLVPQDLDRIIAKALEGDKQVRYQHASQLRADLKRLKRDSEAGLHRVPPTVAKVRNWRWPVVAGLAICAAAVCGVALYLHLHGERKTPFRRFTILRMTDTENVQFTAISPDGNYLATVRKGPGGKQSLWVHHLPSNTERQLMGEGTFLYRSIRFSPDSSYIYIRGDAVGNSSPPPANASDDLYRLPVIGGEPSLVVRWVDSQVTFVGDGQRLCFYRGNLGTKTYSFVGTSIDGGDEKVLGKGDDLPSATACSPDGKRMAVSYHSDQIHIIDFATGRSSILYRPQNDRWLVYGITWTPDGKGMIVSTADKGKFLLQLGYVAYPSGEFHEITNNLNTYSHGVTLTADGRTMAATEGRRESTFYLAPIADPAKLREAPFKWIDSFAWLTDRKLVAAGSDSVLKAIDLDSAEPTILRVPKGYFFTNPSKCGDDSVVAVGGSQENPTQGIFRIGLDGNSFQQLTHGERDLNPRCTPDAQWLIFENGANVDSPRLTAMPLRGGATRDIAPSGGIGISSDGKLVAVAGFDGGSHLSVFSVGAWRQVGRIDLPMGTVRSMNFSPDDESILAVANSSGAGSIWRLPLDGSAPKQLLAVPGKQIASLKLSPDGTQLAFTALASPADAVILKDKD
jgi:serine/threonine protein kinase